jgi:PAS domain S-box-containing protein
MSVNPALAKIFGYDSPEDFIDSVTDLASQAYGSPEYRREFLRQIAAQGYVQNFEAPYIKKDGSRGWLVMNARAVRDNQDNIVCYEGMIQDINYRKRAEEALRSSEERFRAIFEEGPFGMILSDTQGLFFKTNSFFRNMLGYTENEIDRLRFKNFTHPDDVEKGIEHIRKMYTGEEKIYRTEKRYIRKNGETIWGALTLSSVRNADGEFLHFLGIIEDITLRKRAEEERGRLQELLSRSEKMEALGKLAGGVAHDLNNILGVLVGYSELMLMEIPEKHLLRRHVTNILQSGERAAAIIQDLLTLSRRGVAVSKIVNLNKIIADYLETPEFESLKFRHPKVVFKTNFNNDALNIKGSPVHLGQTVMNLIANAAESITNCGEVIISTEKRYLDLPIQGYEDIREGDYLLLTITDNGMGISPKNLNRIFEPFYTKKIMGRSGTGLGLAVVWGTLKDHNGYIDVRSEEGKGSSFNLYFPVSREVPTDIQKSPAASVYAGRGETILIVDDVKEQRELAIIMLSSLGYKVHAVSSGEEAVDYLKTNKVDLLVLDMIMDPGIDGLETYMRILEIKPRQKAVIVSGFSETDRVKKAQELGAGEYVLKPYVMEHIGLAIRRELEKM